MTAPHLTVGLERMPAYRGVRLQGFTERALQPHLSDCRSKIVTVSSLPHGTSSDCRIRENVGQDSCRIRENVGQESCQIREYVRLESCRIREYVGLESCRIRENVGQESCRIRENVR